MVDHFEAAVVVVDPVVVVMDPVLVDLASLVPEGWVGSARVKLQGFLEGSLDLWVSQVE